MIDDIIDSDVEDLICIVKLRFSDFGLVFKYDIRRTNNSVCYEVHYDSQSKAGSILVGSIVFYNDYLRCYLKYNEKHLYYYDNLDIDILVGLFLCEAYYG